MCRRGRRWWLRRHVALSQVSRVSGARESVLAFVFTESSQVSRMSRWLPYEKIGSPCVRARDDREEAGTVATGVSVLGRVRGCDDDNDGSCNNFGDGEVVV